MLPSRRKVATGSASCGGVATSTSPAGFAALLEAPPPASMNAAKKTNAASADAAISSRSFGRAAAMKSRSGTRAIGYFATVVQLRRNSVYLRRLREIV
jgi:hypothetical protein